MITIDDSNPAYHNVRNLYIKNHCAARDDGLHCNSYLFGRSGAGCPCIMTEAKKIKNGEEFFVIEPEV